MIVSLLFTHATVALCPNNLKFLATFLVVYSNFLIQALCYKKYSTASDVWSFGAVMYEIWSVGHKPFESVDNGKVGLVFL